MGYYVEQIAFEVHINKSDEPAALRAIKSLKGKETCGDHFSWVSTDKFMEAKSLSQALWAWGWKLERDGNGDVNALIFDNEKLGDDEKLLNAIAPYVREGSWIEMQGDDWNRWRWVFDGKTCKRRSPVISW